MLAQPERLADDPATAVARDRAAGDLGRDGESQPRLGRAIRARDQAEESVADAAARGVGRVELGLAAQTPSRREPETLAAGASRRETAGYGISFLRPFARLRARTLRPFAVAIRARNPCVRLRRTLLG